MSNKINGAKLIRSGYVQRYHQHPELARLGQTNAAHQWGVAMIILALHSNPSASLLKKALTHDVGEIDVGDLSGPFKRKHMDFAITHEKLERHYREETLNGMSMTLSKEDKKWVKFADKFEALLFVKLHRIDMLSRPDWLEYAEYCFDLASDIECREAAHKIFKGIAPSWRDWRGENIPPKQAPQEWVF